MTRYGLFSTVIGYRMDGLVSISGRQKNYFSSPDRLWDLVSITGRSREFFLSHHDHIASGT
jgi:hypothetical protein